MELKTATDSEAAPNRFWALISAPAAIRAATAPTR
jgi:hypothetical protein